MKRCMLSITITLIALAAFAENNFSVMLLTGRSHFSDTDAYNSLVGIRGSYSMNKHLAFEVSYLDYGENESSYYDGGDKVNSKISTKAFGSGVKGSVYLQHGISAFGRTGISGWNEVENNVTSVGESYRVEDRGIDIYYGVGLLYKINTKSYVNVEYTIMNYNITSIQSVALSAGLVY